MKLFMQNVLSIYITLFVTVTSGFLLILLIHDSGNDKQVLGNLLIVKVIFIHRHFWGGICSLLFSSFIFAL